MKSRIRTVLTSTLLLAATLAALADPSTPPPYVGQAETLVQNLQHASLNVYGKGRRDIHWAASDCSARSVCSSFVTLLLEHTYHWTDKDIKQWMGMTDPQAEDYHDAVAHHNGFTQIHHITEIQPGDILAIRYNDGSADTGHVMLVDQAPVQRDATDPVIAHTTQYDVTVIDSSASGHGPKDSRYLGGGKFTGGIGRGTCRLYASDDGKLVGYAWSDSAKSEYYTRPGRTLVVGRPQLNAPQSSGAASSSDATPAAP